MIGMNDAAAVPAGREAFGGELHEMIRLVRLAGALPILHRTNPVDPQPLDANNTSSRQRADLPAFNEIIAQVAHETNTILIDHWARWQEAKPTPAPSRSWLADPIHPNGAGRPPVCGRVFPDHWLLRAGRSEHPTLSPAAQTGANRSAKRSASSSTNRRRTARSCRADTSAPCFQATRRSSASP